MNKIIQKIIKFRNILQLKIIFIIFFILINLPIFSMTNPASSYCEKIGGKIQIFNSKNGQYGICIKGKKKSEEWKLFHKKCKL